MGGFGGSLPAERVARGGVAWRSDMLIDERHLKYGLKEYGYSEVVLQVVDSTERPVHAQVATLGGLGRWVLRTLVPER